MIETAAVSNVRDITFWKKKSVGRLNDISGEGDCLKTAQFFPPSKPALNVAVTEQSEGET
jgi:hypothetical protein